MGTERTVSVVVPVYNVRDELQRCADSIIGQTYAGLEIILVDDGSTDGSGQICDRLSETDSRIRVIHKANGGLSSARNSGLREATGEWVMYVDADDAIALDACQKFMSLACESRAEILVGDAVHEVVGGSETMLHTCVQPHRDYSSRDFIIECVLHKQFYAPAPFALYRRKFLLSKGLFFADGLLYEDMEMLPRVYLSASCVACTGEVFYRYIDRPGSIMNDRSKRQLQTQALKRIYTGWKALFDQIDDIELRRCLYGFLAKCYLYSCRTVGDLNLQAEGITARFLFANGLDAKERMKALVYGISPALWGRL